MYSISSIRILLRWLLGLEIQVLTLASGITTYKYGIGERQLYLLGITTAENSASFYIAHIVHYSPLHLPAARTDER